MNEQQKAAKHEITAKFGRSLARLDRLKDSIREVKAAGMLQKADKAEATLQNAAELLTELVFLSGELINEISRLHKRVFALEAEPVDFEKGKQDHDTATN